MGRLRFRPEVADDLQEARRWYEARRLGLGDAFLEAIAHCNTAIEAQPHLFEAVHKSVRRALVGQFPYAVFFVIVEDRIEVLAVLHVRRAPDTWRART